MDSSSISPGLQNKIFKIDVLSTVYLKFSLLRSRCRKPGFVQKPIQPDKSKEGVQVNAVSVNIELSAVMKHKPSVDVFL